MPTIAELIERPEEHTGEIAALFEIFSGERNGPQRAAYLRQREAALQGVLEQEHWYVHSIEAWARRIDGLLVCQWHRGDATGWDWCLTLPVMFPAIPDQIWLEVQDLASAMLEVEHRFPLAPWWPGLNHAAHRAGHNPTPPGGFTPK